MNTIAHLVVASAVLSRPAEPNRNKAVLAGALVPDVSMFVFFAWSRIQGWSGAETWNVHYWTDPWQTLGALSNSFILFGIMLIIGLWRRSTVLLAVSWAALLHLALDFPLHADAAHRHFWPLTDWRFFSPVSYWDPDYNGLWGSALETAIALGALAVLWFRFQRPTWRIAFVALAALQLAAFSLLTLFG